MAFEITASVKVRATAERDGDVLFSVAQGDVLFGAGQTVPDADATLTWASIYIPNTFLTGWIPSSRYREVPDPASAPLDDELFVRQCLLADRMISNAPKVAPHFANADFILSRAIFETNMKVTRFGDASLIDGPFRLGKNEWNDLLQSGIEAAVGFTPDDGAYPMSQVFAAAWRMHLDAKAFAEAAAGMAPPEQGPAVASCLNLMVCYLLGDPAKAFEIFKLEGDAAATLNAVLSVEQITALQRRAPFIQLKPETPIAKFVAIVEARLGDLLDAAFVLISKHAADELPSPKIGADLAPWLPVARAEATAGVSEAGSPERIREYFKSTDYGAALNPLPHWCGAFTAFCMAQAGEASRIPGGAARAANWKGWGDGMAPVSSNDIPVGAVVVLQPGATTSGHVAFFTGFDEKGRLGLLGGNQGDKVRTDFYPPSRVAAIRVLKPIEETLGDADEFDLSAAGVGRENLRYGDLIVARFKQAGLGKRQQLLAALANAIAESNMNPAASSAPPERSYGLFQCNTARRALGHGFTPDELRTPEINISIIIKAAKASRRFVAASSLEVAMDAFVREVERPAKPGVQVTKRLAIAKEL